MRLDFHTIKEAGVDPSSIGFSFTPLPATRELYFYITECGHYFCNRNYATKRDYYSPILVPWSTGITSTTWERGM